MRTVSGTRAILWTALALVVVGTACGTPTGSKIGAGARGSAEPMPLACPTRTSLSATAVINPLVGGRVSAGGSSITLPRGALSVALPVTLTVPASTYMEVVVTAGDLPHVQFLVPVQIAIDYSRCTRSDIERAPLQVWYWDSATKTLLENMHGVDDPASHTVTFSTGHLSSYVIAQ